MAGLALSAQDSFPSITCSDIKKSVHFYGEGLGFEIAHKMDAPDGSLMFASMKAGTATIGIGQDDFKLGNDRKKGVGLRIWLVTNQDIKAIAARAMAAGLKLDEGPAPLPWGPMAFAVTDPDGFKLTICAPMDM
jgi:uncharacterized glyoxalase superfamily protein PhnB